MKHVYPPMVSQKHRESQGWCSLFLLIAFFDSLLIAPLTPNVSRYVSPK